MIKVKNLQFPSSWRSLQTERSKWGFHPHGILPLRGLGGFFLILSTLFCTSCTAADDKKPEGKELVYYSYNHHGTMAQPNKDIEVIKTDSTCTACVFYNEDESLYRTYSVGEDLLDSIQNIILEHKIYKYKDHYKPAFEVLDGDSWSYSVHYSDKTYLRSGGYCAGPKDDGLDIINNIITEYVKKCEVIKTEEWGERDR